MHAHIQAHIRPYMHINTTFWDDVTILRYLFLRFVLTLLFIPRVHGGYLCPYRCCQIYRSWWLSSSPRWVCTNCLNRIQKYIHAYMHTYIHTYIRTYVHAVARIFVVVFPFIRSLECGTYKSGVAQWPLHDADERNLKVYAIGWAGNCRISHILRIDLCLTNRAY